MFGASSELASVMEFGFKLFLLLVCVLVMAGTHYPCSRAVNMPVNTGVISFLDTRKHGPC